MKHYQTDVAVIGAGLAGIVTALELLDCGYTVACDRNWVVEFFIVL